MSTTFEHRVERVDDLTVTFTSKAVHPDAGIAWPWHHALHALAGVPPHDSNPIAARFGERLYDDAEMQREQATLFTSVKQEKHSKKTWQTTVVLADRALLPAAVAPGFAWSSGA